MYRLVIAAHGDNEALHRKALEAAVKAVEEINHAPVYRAYLERVEGDKIVGVPNPVTEFQCPECREWSPSADWSYDEQRDPEPGDYEWWWTCPRCGTETPNYPPER